MSREDILNKVNSTLSQVSDSSIKTHSFYVDVQGMEGEFTVKYPALMDKVRIGTIRARMTDGVPSEALDVVTDNISFMSATLEVVVVKSPSWFNINTLEEYEILETVYNKYQEWVSTFRNKPKQGKDAGGSQERPDEKTVEGNEDI